MATKTTKTPVAKKARPKTVADYLAGATRDQRAALMRLRKTVKAAAPQAVESISYGLVGFKYKRKPVIYYAYWKEHCSVYGMGKAILAANADALRGYVVERGTIRFAAGKPLPDRLVTKMVKARIAEIESAR
jgi:uncharacterized protein YdhG (YjbR/CyaY superfamily)